MVTTCSNCGGNQLSLSTCCQSPTHVTDGRLRLNEISIIGILGCDECSETLEILRQHEVDQLLNSAYLKKAIQ